MKSKTTKNRHFPGIRVKDASKPLHVSIKPQDVKNAICSDHQKCAVAKAILRQQGSTAKWVDVGAQVVLVGRSSKSATRYFLDPMGRQQVAFFDRSGGVFAPSRIEMRVPKPSRILGERPDERSGGKNRHKRSRNPSTR